MSPRQCGDSRIWIDPGHYTFRLFLIEEAELRQHFLVKMEFSGASMTAQPFQAPSNPVAMWTPNDKLGEAMHRALPLLGPTVRGQIQQLLTAEALAVIAGVMVVWISSHAVGVGFIADAVLLSVGIYAIGAAVFEGLDHLYQFARRALLAKHEADLDAAANHFSKAVAIIGVEAVLAILFRRTPKTFLYKTDGPERARPANGKPKLRGSRNLDDFNVSSFDKEYYRQGPTKESLEWMIPKGETNKVGEIVIFRPPPGRFNQAEISAHRLTRRQTALHESVHRALSPKLKLLYRFRVHGRYVSYHYSSFSRYLEEVVAEAVARYGISGFKASFYAIKFPVRNGYVTLIKREEAKGSPVLAEISGIVVGSFLVKGMLFDIYLKEGPMPQNGTTP